MPFIEDARRIYTTLPSGPYKEVLRYLLRYGVGRANAIPTIQLLRHLEDRGMIISANQFQQTILKQTRENEIFIASSNRGYFLIENEEDAIVMRDFYQDRIAAENNHLENLRRLARQMEWTL